MPLLVPFGMQQAAVEDQFGRATREIAAVRGDQGRTGARPASFGDAGSPLPDAETNAAVRHHAGDLDIRSLRKHRMMLDQRSRKGAVDRPGILDEDNAMGVADADRDRADRKSP